MNAYKNPGKEPWRAIAVPGVTQLGCQRDWETLPLPLPLPVSMRIHSHLVAPKIGDHSRDIVWGSFEFQSRDCLQVNLIGAICKS
jgi:hypothetical protein